MCVVGRCYPPEVFSWVENTKVRNLFERIAVETEEDLQKIINKLQQFGVEVCRPEIDSTLAHEHRFRKPPITPRDHMVMIGQNFYESYSTNFCQFDFDEIKDPAWPDCANWDQWNQLPLWIKNECKENFNFGKSQNHNREYDGIFDFIRDQGNEVRSGKIWVNGAMVARIGRDLFFGTDFPEQDLQKTKKNVDREFKETRNHVVNTGGHSDATYCPVCPGLIISTHDITSYQDTFPGWEVVYIQADEIKDPAFSSLQKRNKGKWWIPGSEQDDEVINFVERYLDHWVGNVIETVFDVNMLIVDPKNVMVFNENQTLFGALERYGMTPHVVNFRHRFFWDGGLHCLTVDLDRQGTVQDFFPQKGLD